jgi:hypothetical protein
LLSPAERADLAQKLVLTIGDDADDATRLAALRTAVGAAPDSIDAGGGIHVSAGGTRQFVRKIGHEATALIDPTKAVR